MAKKDKDKGAPGWVGAVEALAARLDRLEAAAIGAAAVQPPEPETGPAGRVRITVRAPGGDWRHELTAAAVLAADWPAQAARLAALGHPVRLAILRAAIAGTAEASALQQAAGAATPGQFYHHLRELTAAGWLVAGRRGRYALPPARAGALIAAIALALA
jgi:DNA-binding transcriptional ArsR family regulator